MRQFMSFVDGTSMSSSRPLNSEDEGNDGEYLSAYLDRWGDRRVPRNDDERRTYRNLNQGE